MHHYPVTSMLPRLRRLHLDERFFKPPDDFFTWISETLGFGLDLEVEATGHKDTVFSFSICRAFATAPYVESLRLIAERRSYLESKSVLALWECTHPLFRHLRRLNVVFEHSPWGNSDSIPWFKEFQLLLSEDGSGTGTLVFPELEELEITPMYPSSYEADPTTFDEIFRQLTDARVSLSAYYSYDRPYFKGRLHTTSIK